MLHQFMVVPNHASLRLKMLGPRGIITVTGSFSGAYECDKACVKHTDHVITEEELEFMHELK